jgi:hypothetical protein
MKKDMALDGPSRASSGDSLNLKWREAMTRNGNTDGKF